MAYRVVNWEKYQARNDRDTNPWVKWHKSVLTSRSFFSLPVAIRWQWPLLLCLADHNTGNIEMSDADIAFKLRFEPDSSFDPRPFIRGRFLEPLGRGSRAGSEGCPDRDQEKNETKSESEIRVPVYPGRKTRGGAPMGVGEIASSLASLVSTPSMVDRIRALTGDGEAWMSWWSRVAECFNARGQAHALMDKVEEQELARDPVIRRAKGLSPYRNMGRGLASWALQYARERRIHLPDMPAGSA